MANKYWWKNDGIKHCGDGSVYVDGWHHLCYNEKGDSDFYIQEVAVCYDNWPEEKRKDYFGDAKYVWGGCSGGVGYSHNALKAETIEEARSEFEEIYYKMLSDRVKALNKAKRIAIDEESSFRLYLEKKKQHTDNPQQENTEVFDVPAVIEIDIQELIKEIDRLFLNYGRDTDAFTVDYDEDSDHLYCYYVPHVNDSGYAVLYDFLWVSETSKKDLQTLKEYLDANKIHSRLGYEWEVDWGYTEE